MKKESDRIQKNVWLNRNQKKSSRLCKNLVVVNDQLTLNCDSLKLLTLQESPLF